MMFDGGGWQTEEVALAQRKLIEHELQAPDAVAPYANFLGAMSQLKPLPGMRLLDIGCGCGHYGLLLRERYPEIVYTGSDFSAAMTEQAQELNPISEFRVCEFAANVFAAFDIVLASQVLEYQPDPWKALELLLSKAKRYIILHRIRLTQGISHARLEATYAGHVGNIYLWNLEELMQRIEQRAEIVYMKPWDGNRQVTFVLETAT